MFSGSTRNLVRIMVLLGISWKAYLCTMILAKEFFNLILDFGDDWMVIDIEVDSKDNMVYLDLKYIGKVYYDPDSMEPAPL